MLKLQLAIPSVLSTSPDESGVVITSSQHINKQTGPPLYVPLCPDWIKWAGIADHLFFLLLHEYREERHRFLTKHSITVNTVGIQRFLTLILIQFTAALMCWIFRDPGPVLCGHLCWHCAQICSCSWSKHFNSGEHSFGQPCQPLPPFQFMGPLKCQIDILFLNTETSNCNIDQKRQHT